MGTGQGRCEPETRRTSDTPVSSAAAGVLCSLASLPGAGGHTGRQVEKVCFIPNSRGGWEDAGRLGQAEKTKSTVARAANRRREGHVWGGAG